MRKLKKMNDLDMKRAEFEAYIATGGNILDWLLMQNVLLEQRIAFLEDKIEYIFPTNPDHKRR